jgi:hypothetical protein
MTLASIAAEAFTPYVNRPFTLRAADGSVEVELAEVRVMPPRYNAPEATRKAFSLIFLGPEGMPLPEGAYELTPPGEDPMASYFVPLGWQDRRLRLQVIFS